MMSISDALYESFNYDEDFQDEILDSLEETGSLEESKENSRNVRSKVSKNDTTNESLLKEEMSIDQALDEFYELMIKQDLGPARAKSIVLKDMGIQESLTEDMEKVEEKPLSREERRAKRKSDYMKEACDEFRKSANFFLDEELDEDKLKYEGWRIKNIAIRKGIPSEDLKEALLKGNK